MQIPDYYLERPRPSFDYTADFEQLYRDIVSKGDASEIHYELKAPKWQFLCYLADKKNMLMHGSSNPAIETFEPRQSIDSNEFGNRRAVYAASDGIWAMFFAVVNRDRVTSLVNTCFRIVEDAASGPYYYFSIDKEALPDSPWRNGTVYVLPKHTFEQHPVVEKSGLHIEFCEWASLEAVKPIAKITVTPEDFPFLNHVNGHDPVVISKRASLNPEDFPWRD